MSVTFGKDAAPVEAVWSNSNQTCMSSSKKPQKYSAMGILYTSLGTYTLDLPEV